MRRKRDGQRGLTMTEIMVSVMLVGVAAAFTFSIQVRASSAFRDQQSVAEMQQTLRAASDLIARDVRQAGFMANYIETALQATGPVRALSVVNGGGGYGSDVINMIFADLGAMAHITKNQAPPFNAAVTTVDQFGGIVDGDVVMAVRTKACAGPPATPIGAGCILKITGLVNGGPKLQHNPGQGSPYNQPGNTQCDNISSCWSDGYTLFVKVQMRGYRIKPADPRGVLQMSRTMGLVSGDWEDIALGIVDLQAAIRVWEPADAVDRDGDGDPQRDWYSGAGLTTILDTATFQPLIVTISLLAKTTHEVSGAQTDKTPDIFEASKPVNYNAVGDKTGTTLPVTDTASPYYGATLFRMHTMSVDLRNVAIGVGN